MKKIYLVTTLILFITSSFNSLAQPENYLKNRILVEGFYTRNLGNFGEVWAKSAGGYVGYGIAFPDHNLLMLRTGFISNSLKDNVNYEDASSIIIPLEIGGRYYFINDRFMPFFQFMNGLNIVFENTDLEGEKENKTLVKYAWQLGFGLTVNLLSNLNFDLGVNYQSNFYKTETMMTGFEYCIGIAWKL